MMGDSVATLTLGINTAPARAELALLRTDSDNTRASLKQLQDMLAASKFGAGSMDALRRELKAAQAQVQQLSAALQKNLANPKLRADAEKTYQGIATSAKQAFAQAARAAEDSGGKIKVAGNVAASGFKVLFGESGPTEGLAGMVAAVRGTTDAVVQGLNAIGVKTKEQLQIQKAVVAQMEALNMRATRSRLQSAIAANTGAGLPVSGETKYYRDLEAQVGRVIGVASKPVGGKSNVAKATEELRLLHDAARGAAAGIGYLWMTWGNISAMAAGFTGVATIRKTITSGADFEQKMQFAGTVGGLSDREIANAGRELAELSRRGVYSANELAEAMRELQQAGLSVRETFSVLPTAERFSMMAEVPLNEAATDLYKIMNMYQKSLDEIPRIADMVARVGSDTPAGARDMMRALVTAVGLSTAYGVELQESLAMIGSLSTEGIKGSPAGTFSRNFVKELYTPRTERAGSMLEMLNVNPFNADQTRRPFVEVVRDLAVGMSGMTDKVQSEAFAKTFQERGFRTATNLFKSYETAAKAAGISVAELVRRIREAEAAGETYDGAGTFETLIKSAESAEGTLEAFYARVKDTLGYRWKNLVANFIATLNEIFDRNKDHFKSVVDNLIRVVSSPGFASGLSAIISGLATMTSFLVENGKAVLLLVAAFAQFRLIGAAAKVLGNLSSGFLSARNSSNLALQSFLAVANGSAMTASRLTGMRGAVSIVGSSITTLGGLLLGFIGGPWALLLNAIGMGATAWFLYRDKQNQAMGEAELRAETHARRVRDIMADRKDGLTPMVSDDDLIRARKKLSDAKAYRDWLPRASDEKMSWNPFARGARARKAEAAQDAVWQAQLELANLEAARAAYDEKMERERPKLEEVATDTFDKYLKSLTTGGGGGSDFISPKFVETFKAAYESDKYWLDQAVTAVKQAYQDRTLSAEDYYTQLDALTRRQFDNEREMLMQQRKELADHLKRLEAQSSKAGKPSQQEKNSADIKKVREELAKLDFELAKLNNEETWQLSQNARAAQKDFVALTMSIHDAVMELEALQERGTAVDLASVAERARSEYLLKKAPVLNAPETPESVIRGINAEGDRLAAAAQVAELSRAYDELGKELQSLSILYDSQVASGQITQGQAQERLREATSRLSTEFRDRLAPEYARLQEILKQYPSLLREVTDLFNKLQTDVAKSAPKTWLDGMRDGMNSYLDSIGTAAERTQEITSRAFKGMEDALVNFVMTGKFEIKELLRVILADIVRFQAQSLIKDLFGQGQGTGMMGGSWGGTKQGSNLFGDLLNGIKDSFSRLFSDVGQAQAATTSVVSKSLTTLANGSRDAFMGLFSSVRSGLGSLFSGMMGGGGRGGGLLGGIVSGIGGLFGGLFGGGGSGGLFGGITSANGGGFWDHTWALGQAGMGFFDQYTLWPSSFPPPMGSLTGAEWFADGGVMTSAGRLNLRRYSKGGIANSPQLALFGEGRQNEAYVPLPDGRSIPVTINKGQESGSPVPAPEPQNIRIVNAFDVGVVADYIGSGEGERLIMNVVNRNSAQIRNIAGRR